MIRNGNISDGNRIAYYDNIKGFLILLVVIGHFASPLSSSKMVHSMIDFIFLFHMPFFVFISGLFGSSDKSGSNSKWAKKTWNFFLIYCFMFLFICLALVISGVNTTFNPFSAWGGSIAWYMMCMVWFTLLAPFIYSSKPLPMMLFLVGLSLFSGLYPIGDTLTLSRTIVFLPVFAMGLYIRFENVLHFRTLSKVRKLSNGFKVLFISITAGSLFALYKLPLEIDIIIKGLSKGRTSYQEIISDSGLDMNWQYLIAGRLMIYLISAILIFIILIACPIKRIPFLNQAGENSLRIYFYHAPIYYIAEYTGIVEIIAKPFPQESWCILSIALSIFVTWILLKASFLDKLFDLTKNIAERLRI